MLPNVKLPLLELGEGKPTMMNLSVANQVIKTVNGVRGLNFLPGGIARVDIGDDAVTVTLKIKSIKMDVLVIEPTDMITSVITEISEPVSWPDATACAVDIGDQDPSIGFAGYRVSGGNLYLRWWCSGSGQPLADKITITAFLES